jgi:hypothetical protein
VALPPAPDEWLVAMAQAALAEGMAARLFYTLHADIEDGEE